MPKTSPLSSGIFFLLGLFFDSEDGSDVFLRRRQLSLPLDSFGFLLGFALRQEHSVDSSDP
jgi:hypothetical protein